MAEQRRLVIPQNVPEDFANAVATVLMLGIASRAAWEHIYQYTAEQSMEWIAGILEYNDLTGLVHTDLTWWRSQITGH